MSNNIFRDHSRLWSGKYEREDGKKKRYRDLLEGAVMIGEIFISPSER